MRNQLRWLEFHVPLCFLLLSLSKPQQKPLNAELVTPLFALAKAQPTTASHDSSYTLDELAFRNTTTNDTHHIIDGSKVSFQFVPLELTFQDPDAFDPLVNGNYSFGGTHLGRPYYFLRTQPSQRQQGDDMYPQMYLFFGRNLGGLESWLIGPLLGSMSGVRYFSGDKPQDPQQSIAPWGAIKYGTDDEEGTMEFHSNVSIHVTKLTYPTCSNRIRDGDETEIDCGGSCSPCADRSFCDLHNETFPGANITCPLSRLYHGDGLSAKCGMGWRRTGAAQLLCYDGQKFVDRRGFGCDDIFSGRLPCEYITILNVPRNHPECSGAFRRKKVGGETPSWIWTRPFEENLMYLGWNDGTWRCGIWRSRDEMHDETSIQGYVIDDDPEFFVPNGQPNQTRTFPATAWSIHTSENVPFEMVSGVQMMCGLTETAPPNTSGPATCKTLEVSGITLDSVNANGIWTRRSTPTIYGGSLSYTRGELTLYQMPKGTWVIDMDSLVNRFSAYAPFPSPMPASGRWGVWNGVDWEYNNVTIACATIVVESPTIEPPDFLYGTSKSAICSTLILELKTPSDALDSPCLTKWRWVDGAPGSQAGVSMTSARYEEVIAGNTTALPLNLYYSGGSWVCSNENGSEIHGYLQSLRHHDSPLWLVDPMEERYEGPEGVPPSAVLQATEGTLRMRRPEETWDVASAQLLCIGETKEDLTHQETNTSRLPSPYHMMDCGTVSFAGFEGPLEVLNGMWFKGDGSINGAPYFHRKVGKGTIYNYKNASRRWVIAYHILDEVVIAYYDSPKALELPPPTGKWRTADGEAWLHVQCIDPQSPPSPLTTEATSSERDVDSDSTRARHLSNSSADTPDPVVHSRAPFNFFLGPAPEVNDSFSPPIHNVYIGDAPPTNASGDSPLPYDKYVEWREEANVSEIPSSIDSERSPSLNDTVDSLPDSRERPILSNLLFESLFPDLFNATAPLPADAADCNCTNLKVSGFRNSMLDGLWVLADKLLNRLVYRSVYAPAEFDDANRSAADRQLTHTYSLSYPRITYYSNGMWGVSTMPIATYAPLVVSAAPYYITPPSGSWWGWCGRTNTWQPQPGVVQCYAPPQQSPPPATIAAVTTSPHSTPAPTTTALTTPVPSAAPV